MATRSSTRSSTVLRSSGEAEPRDHALVALSWLNHSRSDPRGATRARPSRLAFPSMPIEASTPGPLRLFAALDIPGAVRAGLAAWGDRELTDPALRPVAAENLHMTLCFLGRTDASRVDEASEAIAALPVEPVPVRLSPRPAGRPRSRPAVWALEADAPAGTTLHGLLSAALAKAGLYEPCDRPFWAHLTVARTRPERGKGRRPRRVEKPPGELPAELSEPFDAVRVSLYRSDLRSDGAKYVSLALKNLPPSA